MVNNERLTAELPVYLKQLTIQVCGPLPFSDTSLGAYKFGSSYPELLDTGLQELDGNSEHLLTGDIPIPSDYELASQEAIEISLGFYIKVPIDYAGIVPETFKANRQRQPREQTSLSSSRFYLQQHRRWRHPFSHCQSYQQDFALRHSWFRQLFSHCSQMSPPPKPLFETTCPLPSGRIA